MLQLVLYDDFMSDKERLISVCQCLCKKKKKRSILDLFKQFIPKKKLGQMVSFPICNQIFTFIITFSSSSESENTFETAKIKNASKGI